MKHEQPILLGVPGRVEPTEEFLLCYKREILCVLAEQDIIDPKTLADCMEMLEL